MAGERLSGSNTWPALRIDLVGVWIYARGDHVASLGDRLGFGSTRKQAVVADAVEHVETTEAVVKAGYSVARLRLVYAVV
jgi:hypothetical protein